jgi:hypothetical protein
MKEHPVLFSTPMVQALLNTKPGVWPAEPADPSKPFKFMTRRIIKNPVCTDRNNYINIKGFWINPKRDEGTALSGLVPYSIGDILWVRETWKVSGILPIVSAGFTTIEYKAGGKKEVEWCQREWARYKNKFIKNIFAWRSPLFLPREAARIFLEVKNVRIERVQDITEEDALAEGVGKEWLKNWIKQFGTFSPANWFYYDPENRYWCDKHIDKALKQFRQDVREGKITIAGMKDWPMKSIMEELTGYFRDTPEEEYPLYCEICGEPLDFSAMKNLINRNFDECLNETWNKYHVPLIDSLLWNYEEEFFSKPNIYRLMFRALWDTLNAGKGYSWERNPWVWVIDFMRIK